MSYIITFRIDKQFTATTASGFIIIYVRQSVNEYISNNIGVALKDFIWGKNGSKNEKNNPFYYYLLDEQLRRSLQHILIDLIIFYRFNHIFSNFSNLLTDFAKLKS